MTYQEYLAETRDPRTQEAVDYCNKLNQISRQVEISKAVGAYSQYEITEKELENEIRNINKNYN